MRCRAYITPQGYACDYCRKQWPLHNPPDGCRAEDLDTGEGFAVFAWVATAILVWLIIGWVLL